MEIKVLNREKDRLELEIKDADENLLYPLVNQLLQDDSVAEAKFEIGLQQTDIPRLFIRMKEGKPQTALKKASKQLSTQFETAKKAFDKAIK